MLSKKGLNISYCTRFYFMYTKVNIHWLMSSISSKLAKYAKKKKILTSKTTQMFNCDSSFSSTRELIKGHLCVGL